MFSIWRFLDRFYNKGIRMIVKVIDKVFVLNILVLWFWFLGIGGLCVKYIRDVYLFRGLYGFIFGSCEER